MDKSGQSFATTTPYNATNALREECLDGAHLLVGVLAHQPTERDCRGEAGEEPAIPYVSAR